MNKYGKPNRYLRVGTLPLSYLELFKDKLRKNEYKEFFGVNVKITSQRYKVFKENMKCSKCGLEGSFLAIEKDSLLKTENYHMNLYAINSDGKEILMTKDHIKPISKGGKNIHSNYQTMCIICNVEKSNN
jgi:5-methylcytosine-specific restriction endonuclease McrA